MLVKAHLRKQGINPLKVRKKVSPAGRRQESETHGHCPVHPADGDHDGRWRSLLQSFDIIGEGFDNPNMRKLVDEIKQEVSSGNSLANSLRKKPQYFDELYCNLVDAGEQSGALENLLDRVATYKEKRNR